MINAVHELGASVLFLTPYEPGSMLIEVAFCAMKDWLRNAGPIIEHMPLPNALRIAAKAVTPAAARNAFHEPGASSDADRDVSSERSVVCTVDDERRCAARTLFC